MGEEAQATRVRLTRANLQDWPSIQKLYEEGKVKFDVCGRLRYVHGAPVGDMILVRVGRQGQGVYKESTEEWFDPGSPAAERFRWP